MLHELLQGGVQLGMPQDTCLRPFFGGGELDGVVISGGLFHQDLGTWLTTGW